MQVSTLRDQCAALVLELNNRLSTNRSGSLIQVWLPEVNGNAKTVLSTYGLPYAVAGVSDLLALFRCISCRYTFSTDVMQPCLLGAIGRVYTTTEPEVCSNVQKYDKKIYLRVSEAQRCRVHSTVVLPFFEPSIPHRALGVIEVVTNDRNVAFHELLKRVIASLECVHLCTSEIEVSQIEEGLKQWPVDTDLHLFDFGLGLHHENYVQNNCTGKQGSENGKLMSKLTTQQISPMFNYCNNDAVPMTHDPSPAFIGSDDVFEISMNSVFPSVTTQQQETGFSSYPQLDYPGSSRGLMHSQGEGPVFSLGDNGVSGFMGMASANTGAMIHSFESGSGIRLNDSILLNDNSQVLDNTQLQDLFHALVGNKYRKKSRRKMGCGKNLTYNDLKKYFHLGLKDAAAKLGICPTTLKRACRRNGIKRWPSKLAAIKQIKRKPVPELDDKEDSISSKDGSSSSGDQS
eukprot:g1985.t1